MTKLIPDLDEASKNFVFWLTEHKCYLKVSVDYLCKNTNSLNESEELKQDLKEVNLKNVSSIITNVGTQFTLFD